MDYSIFYKQKFENVSELLNNNNLKYDLFISAYNESERVKTVFDKINSLNKHWIILPEYNFIEIELGNLKGEIFNYSNSHDDENIIIMDYFDEIERFQNQKIAIDMTGMLRPYIIFTLRYIYEKKIKNVDFIYSEPIIYKKKENTEFSLSYLKVREIKGFLGCHNPNTSNDFLILCSGFDHHLIRIIAKEKKQTKKIQVLGFPSLQADMFQQNILKISNVEEDASTGDFNLDSNDVILAPANDPFITAQLISDFVKQTNKRGEITNLYLSPLSTKAQSLGMALFYIYECQNQPVSIIFPFSDRYSRETSKGLSKIWVYTIEFPNI